MVTVRSWQVFKEISALPSDPNTKHSLLLCPCAHPQLPPGETSGSAKRTLPLVRPAYRLQGAKESPLGTLLSLRVHSGSWSLCGGTLQRQGDRPGRLSCLWVAPAPRHLPLTPRRQETRGSVSKRTIQNMEHSANGRICTQSWVNHPEGRMIKD